MLIYLIWFVLVGCLIVAAPVVGVLTLAAGNGAAPKYASTTSKWTVLDPTSNTPRRTRRERMPQRLFRRYGRARDTPGG